MELDTQVQDLQNIIDIEDQKNQAQQNFDQQQIRGEVEFHSSERKPDRSYLDQYEILRELGAGYTAKVKLARNVEDQKLYAVKIFKSNFSKEQNLKTLSHEIEMISAINHQNLVNFKEFKNDATYFRKRVGKDGKQEYKCVAIILEYASNGELFDYVARSGMFTEEVARTFFLQLLNGLEYLNIKGLCHRDIKPENILFDEEFNLKLCDFGFSTHLSGKTGTGNLHTVLGTESYMAPEIFLNQNYNGAIVDMFASAIVLFIMVSGAPPFAKADPVKDPHYKILNNPQKNQTFWKCHEKTKPRQNFFSEEFKTLINCMLSSDPLLRPSLPEIKQSPWMQGTTIPIDQLRNQFKNRKQQVDQQLEQDKQELERKKEMESKKSNNAVFTGVRGFRSEGEDKDQFACLDQDFGKYLNKERQLKNISSDCLLSSDLKTLINADHLMKYLLAHSMEEENKIKEKGNIKIDEKKYKINVNDTKNSIEFSIEFLKLDEVTIVVDFKKISGNSFKFQEKTNDIKKLIGSI